MGAYLSEPVTEKISSDESSNAVLCGASCMQGWRVNQEDAHNTILDFDVNTTFLAVYDGHGGAEVAAYCAQHLPAYIKDTEAYKSGDLVKALEEAFLNFDAKIATKEVMDILKEMAGEMNPPPPDEAVDSDEDDVDVENMSNLYKEAQQPLTEVLAQYESHGGQLRAKLGEGGTPMSPFLRAKKSKDEAGGSGNGLSAGTSSSDAGASSSGAGAGASSSGAGASRSNAAGDGGASEAKGEDADSVSSSTNSKGADKDLNGEVTTSSTERPDGAAGPAEAPLVPDSSADTREEPEPSESADDGGGGGGAPADCNGDVTEGKAAENSISSSQNGDSLKPARGKAIEKVVSSSEAPLSPAALRRKKMVPRRAAADIFKRLLLASTPAAGDSDTSDSNDETFEGADTNSDEEENINGTSDSSNDDEEDEEEEAEGEESSDEECEHDMGMTEEPGNDSGCTAVVALLRGNELYVANAGDSRCIVCREGRALDMSVDHKPEDEPELARVTRAGGTVSGDGRINGGLNLSRAIGDHSYKQNKELGPKEQMITALPDVKTLTVDPERDEFLVLACDGIWNFMSSQDVCDFIAPRLKEGRERLSQICEEMFDHCLASNTMGDGTGCDNMTAILVTFKKNAAGTAEVASVTTSECPKKRSADEEASPDANEPKRQKVEDTLSSSVVTSSV